MGLFSDAGSSNAKGKSPAIPFPSEFLPPPLAPARRLRQRVNVPVHQAEWHSQHRVPLPYPDATLPHDLHLDPERIPVPAATRSARAHAEEVRRRRALLTLAAPRPRLRNRLAQLGSLVRLRARGGEAMRRSRSRPYRATAPAVVRNEDQVALATVCRKSEEDERRRATTAKQEESAYEAAMARAMALSAAGDCILPPLTPSSPVKPETELETSPIERYSWTGVVCEWVSAPPVWVRATPSQEARQATAAQAAARPAADMNALWNIAFPWASSAPTLIDLTDQRTTTTRTSRTARRLIV
ncbi:Pre-mRNA-processing factor 39 [Hordeum vulgare]|nr:Pre-mRNA-processing factor 39 [Hordeum vulgare]